MVGVWATVALSAKRERRSAAQIMGGRKREKDATRAWYLVVLA
jgi:hypothetical protein